MSEFVVMQFVMFLPQFEMYVYFTDVDECTSDTHNCIAGAACENTRVQIHWFHTTRAN